MAEVGKFFVGLGSEFDSKGMDRATKAIKGIAIAGAAMGAALAAGVLALTNKASKLEETTSKFNVVFKNQQKLAEEWAKILVASYGVTTEEAKRYLASIQDLLVPMGMNSDAAAKLSNEVVKLSVDLGSFNNLPTEQVMMDIQSALVGNFETMKKYGVVLNATRVEQEVMNKGWAKSKDEITQAMKAEAAYNLIVQGSTAALGDFNRTSDGYANQVKIMRAGINELLTTLGTYFLPVLTDLVKKINDDIIPAFADFVKGLDETGGKFIFLKDSIVNFFDGIKSRLKVIDDLNNKIKQVPTLMDVFSASVKGGFQLLMDQQKKLTGYLNGLYKQDAANKQAAEQAKTESTINTQTTQLAAIQERLVNEETARLEAEAMRRETEEIDLNIRNEVAKKAAEQKVADDIAITEEHLKQRTKLHNDLTNVIATGLRYVSALEVLTWRTGTKAFGQALKERAMRWIQEKIIEVSAAKLANLAIAVMQSAITWGAAAWQIGQVAAGAATGIAGLRALQKMDEPGVVAGPIGKPVLVQALGGEHFGGRESIGSTGNIYVTVPPISTRQEAQRMGEIIGNSIFKKVKKSRRI